MPFPVYGGKAVTDDSLIYIVGGFSDTLFSPVNYIQSFNPRTNEWAMLDATLQTGRYGFVSGVYRNQLYITGGKTTDEKLVHYLERWDFKGSTVIVDSNYNFNRTFATGVVYENYFYIFGGYPNYRLTVDSVRMPYIFGYQLTNEADFYENHELFIENSAANNAPYHQSAILFNNDIYVFGGAYNGILIDVFRFNHREKSWRSIFPALFEERAGADVVQASSERLMIIGGYNESYKAMSFTEYYYPTDNISDYGPELNYARKELMAVRFEDGIYVFGGRNRTGRAVPQVEYLPSVETTLLEDRPEQPVEAFELSGNYPNPFNPTTTIALTTNRSQNIKLEVLDIKGNHIQTLFEGVLQTGKHTFQWKGTNGLGSTVSSGIYFYRATTDQLSRTQRMILLR